MKHKTFIHKVLGVVLATCMVLSMCAVTAFAVTYKLNTSDQAIWDSSDDLQQAAQELGLTNSNGTLTFDPSGFIEKTDKEQKQLVKNFMTEATALSFSASGTNAIMDCLNSTEDIDMSLYLIPYVFDETRGDIVGGMKVISPFMSVINIIIGVLAILASLALVLFSVYDIVIIIVPLFRDKILSKSENSNNGGRPAGVSAEAWSAIQAAEGDNSGKEYKSALWIYLKHRLPVYLVFGIILAYLVFGGFSGLMQALLNIGNQYVN